MVKKQPLLVIEDDPVQQGLIERILAPLPYFLKFAPNAEAAFDAYGKVHPEVVLCDIYLPGNASGVDVLRQLKEVPNPPVVVMLTVEDKVQFVIDTMRLGAYDYLLKPVQQTELENVLKRAFDRAKTDAAARAVERERAEFLRVRLANRQVVEHLVMRQKDRFDRALFGHIFTSFSQGRGVGALTTLIAMISGSPLTPDGSSYIISKDIVDMILDNQGAVNAMIEVFSELNLLVSQNFVLYDVSLGEFHKIVGDLIFELAPVINLRGHTVVLNELPPRFAGEMLRMNWEFMRRAMRELILNALKFSDSGTEVTILIENRFTHILVTVLNAPNTTDGQTVKGIPAEFRKMIFEPFFRLTRVLREEYPTLEFGLGLTLVEKIIHMHNGKLRCTSVENYAQDEGTAPELVAFEIELPI